MIVVTSGASIRGGTIMRSFSFGAVYKRFFHLMGAHFPLIFTTALLLIFLPTLGVLYTLVAEFHLPVTALSDRLDTFDGNGWLYSIAGRVTLYILKILAISIVTEAMIRRASGKTIGSGQLIGNAFANLIPLFFVAISVAMIVIGGTILLIVPGIIWMLATSVAMPAYIDHKGLGVSDSVSKSFEMTRGHRWVLLGIFIVLLLMAIGCGICVGLIWTVFKIAIIRMGAPTLAGLPLLDIGEAVVNGLTSSIEMLGIVMTAAQYLTLRESKGKASPELMAEVFS